jgi:predicted TPR repeat methyltransferase
MLKACEKKGIAKELIEHDLLVFPWPYQDGMFNHAISCGVFHFLDDLDLVFNEISRLQKTGGIFVFTTMKWRDHQHEPEKYGCHIEDGMNIYSHQSTYVNSLLENNLYHKEKEIISSVGETQFRAIVARKAKA